MGALFYRLPMQYPSWHLHSYATLRCYQYTVNWKSKVLKFCPILPVNHSRDHFLPVLPWLLVCRHPPANDLLCAIVNRYRLCFHLIVKIPVTKSRCSERHVDQYLLRKEGVWTVLWMTWNILGNLAAQQTALKQRILGSKNILISSAPGSAVAYF